MRTVLNVLNFVLGGFFHDARLAISNVGQCHFDLHLTINPLLLGNHQVIIPALW